MWTLWTFQDVRVNVDRYPQLKEFANFDFDVWRKRYMRWMNHKKSRVMDFFRRIDKDQDGKVTRQEFIEGILSSSKCFRQTGQREAVGWTLAFNPLLHRIPHQPSGDERRGGHIRPGRRRLHRLL